MIGNNVQISDTSTNKLKWQNELLEKAKNTPGRKIMKDVDREEGMWKYGEGDGGQTKGGCMKRGAAMTGEVHSLPSHPYLSSIVWT